MKLEDFPPTPTFLRGFLLTILILASSALGAGDELTQHVLYRFHGPDGSNPRGNLIAGQAGNLYGTTEYSGPGGYYGTVFELTPPSNPNHPWIETTLYTFKNDGDGARPTDGLVFDHSGNLYGTTSDSAAGGYGEIFELSPPATEGGTWTETILYSFQGGSDGAYPSGGVVFDPAGNLYGATESSVFQLSPPNQRGGSWSFSVLHDFTCCTSDGWTAAAGLVRDPAGDLYGTTEWGGSYTGEYCASLGCGTVFEVSPPTAPGGVWTEKVLYRFGGEHDGLNPLSSLILDAAGNLYGTTYGGGALGGGTVFQLTRPAQAAGTWTKKVLHDFSYGTTDGAAPTAGLIRDPAGNLYGTTEFGGNRCVVNGTAYGCGVLFELTPPSVGSGAWTETLIHHFKTYVPAGKNPGANLLLDKAGNLYGTTIYGGYNQCPGDGSDGCGTVFQILR
jgi:uncharacterized repeat protein (TIGR03803 family)